MHGLLSIDTNCSKMLKRLQLTDENSWHIKDASYRSIDYFVTVYQNLSGHTTQAKLKKKKKKLSGDS